MVFYCHYNMIMLEYTFIREQVYVPHSCYMIYAIMHTYDINII